MQWESREVKDREKGGQGMEEKEEEPFLGRKRRWSTTIEGHDGRSYETNKEEDRQKGIRDKG